MIDLLQKDDTTHDYTLTGSQSAGTGPETIDTYDSTPWTAYANMNSSFSQCSGGRTTSTITSEHTFVSATIIRVRVKWGVQVIVNSGASSNAGGYTLYLQVYRNSAWETVTGTEHSAHGGSVAYTEFDDNVTGLALTGVTKVRAFADAHGDKQCCDACGGSTQAYSSIYEMSAYTGLQADYVNSTGTVPESGSVTDFVKPLQVYSSTNANQGSYAIKAVVSAGANTLDGVLTKTIVSTDLSATTHDTILVDVYALRTGTQFQLGIGEAAVTDNLQDVEVTTANTWETVALDFSEVADGSKDAIIKLGVKFTNTTTGNIVYIDNIRPALSTATWTSPILNTNAGTFGNMYWNETLGTYGEVLVYTKNGTLAAIGAASWSTALTTPTGSAIVSTGGSTNPADLAYFQFKIVFTSTDSTHDYAEFPYLSKAGGYVAKFDYYTVASTVESSVEFIYRTGYKNFDSPFEDKTFKKIVSVHEGTAGLMTLSYDIDNETGTSYGNTAGDTFKDISLVTYPWKWESFFPATAFGRAIRFQYYKDDLNTFKMKQIAVLLEKEPII